MSFLSRLRGRKGYGACGDAAMEREYSNGKPSEAGFRLRAKRKNTNGTGLPCHSLAGDGEKEERKRWGSNQNERTCSPDAMKKTIDTEMQP